MNFRLSSAPLAIALSAAVAAFLVGCGLDDPNTASDDGRVAAAKPAVEVIQGIKPQLATIAAVNESSPSVKCNIETIGDANLEGVRAKVNVKKSVGIAGWYAASTAGDAAKASTGTANVTKASETAPSTTPQATATAGESSGPALQLVIVSEDGSKQWVVPIAERTERPDVADAIHDASALKSGFAFDMNLSDLVPGYYNMHLSDTSHAAGSVCGLGRGFLVE